MRASLRGNATVVFLSCLAAGGPACSPRTARTRAPADQNYLCASPIDGAAAVLVPGTLLLFGEFHGTAEYPRFVADLTCQSSLAGAVVQVGLEIPPDEQIRINTYLDSTGAAGDRESLLQGNFWRRPLQDGRSSRAMVDLLDSIRRLRSSGAKVNVFLFDTATRGPDRDALMAKSILLVRDRFPGHLFVVLVGNVHAMKKKVTTPMGEIVPMGFRLEEAGAQVRSLRGVSPPGTAWVCSGGQACGSQPVRGKHRGDRRFIELTGGDEQGYDGLFYAPSLTASPPAISDVGS